MTILRKISFTLMFSLIVSMVNSVAFAQLPPTGSGFGQPPSGGLPPGGDEAGGPTPPAPDSEIPEECRPAAGEVPDPFCMAPPPAGQGGSGEFPDFPPGGFDLDDLDDIDFDAFEFDDFRNLFDPSMFGSFSADDLDRLSPELTKNLDMSYIENLSPEVLRSVDLSFFQNLNPSAFAGFTPEQVSQLLGSQWSAMNRDQLGELSPDAIRAMGTDMLKQIDPEEFRAMASEDLSKMVVNFDPGKFTATEVKDLLPAGWTLDAATGRLSPPPGAVVVLRELAKTEQNNLSIPRMPDLSTGLAIGGNASAGTVLFGLNKALETAVGESYSFEQDDTGILKVRSGQGTEVAAAFIVDSNAMKQAMPGTLPGITLDEAGKYVLTTPDGLQVPVIPSLQNPEGLLNAITGMSIKIQEAGDTRIEIPGSLPIMCVPDPYVQPSSELPVGIHRNGEGADAQVVIVYPDGTSQLLNPMIQDRESVTNTVLEIPQVRSLQIQVDGSILLDYEGQTLRLRPAYDITLGGGASTQPSIQLTGPASAEFINSQGDRQVFYIQ
jgi:hypothetical protein